jgi:branched-chain amino acid transport system substrate-binding protein
MRNRKLLVVMAMVGVLALVGAACGEATTPTPGAEGAAEKMDVTVYFQGAITGPFNYLVISAYLAAQMRAQELTQDPEFPARITVKPGDTQGDPANAPPIVDEAVSDPETVAIEGPAFSGESEASGDTYNEAQIPFVTPSATNPALGQKGWEFWYRGVANDITQGGPAAQYIAEVIGGTNVFVSHDKSTYGQGLAEIVRDNLQQAEGVEVAGFEGIESGQEDFSAFISAVRASGADVLYFGGYDADFGKVVSQGRDAGLDIPMMSDDGSTSSTLITLAGEALENVHLSCPCNLEGGGDFLFRFRSQFGGAAEVVPIYAAEGYDAMSLIGEGIRYAIEQQGAGSVEEVRAGIKAYLDTLTPDNPFRGVAKTYAFEDTGELAAQDPLQLIYFYEATPESIDLIGSAAEVLGG